MRVFQRFLPLLSVGVVLAGCGVCGNERQERGEECDDGNTSDTDACLSSCVSAVCGDGFVFADQEVCDDGNTVSGDGCSADCQLVEVCGDGVVNQYPDPPHSATVEFAGTSCNGVTEPFELYVDGLVVSLSLTPECTCTPEIQTKEITDPTVLQKLQQDNVPIWVESWTPGLSLGWLALNLEGIGAHQVVVFDSYPPGTAEAHSNDLCTGGMTEFFAGSIVLDCFLGEACDDGNADNTDACPDGDGGTCEAARCGDGFVFAGREACDDGNNTGGDSCPANCKFCDLSGDCSLCANCAVNTTCNSQWDACQSSIDCVEFFDCANNCPTEECVIQCTETYPEGYSIYLEFMMCLLCDACPVDCDGGSSCT